MGINSFGPFSAEVWGTVSEWVVAIVTGGTAWLLYQTFKSQISVQRNQQRITDIEGERFRIEYKPILLIDFKSVKNTLSNVNMQSFLHLSLSITKNDCKNLNIIIQQNITSVYKTTLTKGYEEVKLPIEYVYNLETFNLYFNVSSIAAIFPYEGGRVWFFIEFDDIIGNKYIQEFMFIFIDDLIQSIIKEPKRVLN